MSTDRLPSLLIEAARSAAVADGLAPPQPRSNLLPSIKQETDKKLSLSLTNGEGDTVAAALAMVASGNGGSKIEREVQANVNTSELNINTKVVEQASPPPMTRIAPTTYQNPSANSNSISTTAPQKPNTFQRQLPVTSLTLPPSAGSAAHRLAVAAATCPPPQSVVPLQQKVRPTPQTSTTPVAPRSNGGPTTKKKGPPLRRGKWTAEEEAYANRLIIEFKAGLLPLTDGTTLRTFLSKLLNCDPMRISKKFVGSNCIGKQVFRRRTVDINRLTPDQIQQSRGELSELERRFLERVAQTNRVKTSGVGANNPGGGNGSSSAAASSMAKMKVEDGIRVRSPPSPQWLRPPNGFKHGTGAAVATSSLSSGTINRAVLAGRAMLQTNGNSSMRGVMDQNKSSISSNGSAGILALMEMQRRQSQNNLIPNLSQSLGNSRPSANNILAEAAAAAAESNNNNGNSNLSGPAMAQIARNASAARIAGLAATGNSMTNLMLKTGLSRDQLSQLARDHQRNSSTSIPNMMERQSSLDALMSLDFQSLQSIDNLANLIQTGGSGPQIPRTGMKNWSNEGNSATNHLATVAASMGTNNNVPCGRQLVSDGRVESLIRSLSSNNVGNKMQGSSGSNATFNNLLQSVQSMNNADGSNAANIFGSAASALNLANMLRTDSATGLTALRMQDGLAQRNSSVDDFLSLVASGDIPHQDPHMLNVPLQSVLHQHQNNQSGAQAAATYLAQQQILAQAANSGDGSSLGQKIASLGGLANNSSAASLINQYTQSQSTNAAAVFAQQINEARAATILAAATAQSQNDANGQHKRKLSDQNSAGYGEQRPTKR